MHHLVFDANRNPQARPLAERVREWQEAEATEPYDAYTYGPISDATVGGEPALTYRYVRLDKPTGKVKTTGQRWFFNHGGTRYLIHVEGTNLASAAEAEAIIGSLAFMAQNERATPYLR